MASQSVAAISATTRPSRMRVRRSDPVALRDRSATDAASPPRDASTAGQMPTNTAINASVPIAAPSTGT